MKNKRSRNQADFDELFVQRGGDDPRLVAISFDYTGTMRIKGYEEAIRVLKKHILKTGGDNGTIYPLMFVCRHAVELALKESIVDACRLEDRSIPQKIWSTHDFEKLIDILESTFPRLKKDRGWPKAKAFLYKWDSADPNGEFTRFSRDTDGNSIQIKENVYAGRVLENSIYCMDFLDGLLTGLYEEHNIKTEMNAEMRSNMY